MPELNLRNIRRDLRLPELRLPEMSRDDIAKALGEARKEMREVRKDFDDFRRDFELPKVDVPTADVGRVDAGKVTDGAKQVADGAKQMADTAKQGIMQAAEAAGLVTAPAIGRSRRPFVIAGIAGIATLAIAWLALLNSPAVKTRLRDGVQRARERIAAAQQSSWGVDDEATAFDAARSAAVQPSTYSESLDTADSPYAEPPTELPEGFGADGGTHRIEEDAPARA